MGLRDSDPSVMDYPECKIDTIFSDKIDKGSMEKPIEMFYNIERFWTGQKRCLSNKCVYVHTFSKFLHFKFYRHNEVYVYIFQIAFVWPE